MRADWQFANRMNLKTKYFRKNRGLQDLSKRHRTPLLPGISAPNRTLRCYCAVIIIYVQSILLMPQTIDVLLYYTILWESCQHLNHSVRDLYTNMEGLVQYIWVQIYKYAVLDFDVQCSMFIDAVWWQQLAVLWPGQWCVFTDIRYTLTCANIQPSYSCPVLVHFIMPYVTYCTSTVHYLCELYWLFCYSNPFFCNNYCVGKVSL